MFLTRCGNGPVHYLGVHGWSGDHRTFDPLTSGLPADASFWSVDLPGCGQSAPPREWSVAGIGAELAEVLRGLPPDITVIGNCSGAIFALEAAKHVPVQRIVMIDAFAYWPWYFKVFLAPGWGRYAYMTAFANPLGRWLANLSLASRRAEDTDLTDGFSRVNHAVTYRYLEMLAKVPSPERFRGISSTIDLLHGERSFAAVRKSVALWRDVFPRATSLVLQGAGHLPILEATAQLRRYLFER